MPQNKHNKTSLYLSGVENVKDALDKRYTLMLLAQNFDVAQLAEVEVSLFLETVKT